MNETKWRTRFYLMMGVVLVYAAITSAYCYLGPERPRLVVSRLMAVFLVGVAIMADMVFRHRGEVAVGKGQPWGHWRLARLGLGSALASRVVLLLVLPVSVRWPYWSPQTTAIAISGLCIAVIGILLFMVAGVGMVRAEKKYGK